jgi:hypothetical protein
MIIKGVKILTLDVDWNNYKILALPNNKLLASVSHPNITIIIETNFKAPFNKPFD